MTNEHYCYVRSELEISTGSGSAWENPSGYLGVYTLFLLPIWML